MGSRRKAKSSSKRSRGHSVAAGRNAKRRKVDEGQSTARPDTASREATPSEEYEYRPVTPDNRLPPELWLLIIECWPAVPIEEIIKLNQTRLFPPSFQQRENTLRALSQTCRETRRVCLPLLWAHVQIYAIENDEIPWRHAVAHSLRHQCLGLLKTKKLTAFVQWVVFHLSCNSTYRFAQNHDYLARTMVRTTDFEGVWPLPGGTSESPKFACSFL